MINSAGKRLKIALVIKNFVLTGGAERYAVEVARRLADRGHSIDIYARHADPALTRGMTLFRVPYKLTFSSVLSLYSFARQSAAMVRKSSYDIVHTHDKGCPGHVSTIHTFSFKRGMDGMSLLKKINEFVISPRVWLYLHLEKIQAGSKGLAAVSDIIREDMTTCHGRKDGISVIPPGVDVARFCPEKVRELRAGARREKGLAPDDLAVVFVGSEFRRKGLDALIPAIGKGMRLFVVGRGERMAHYTDLVTRCGLADSVRFEGLVDDVMPYYALADVVVLPSVAEAFGMTVLEGMACGLPVITSRDAGCSFLVESGKNGLVFEEPKELEGLLENLWDEPLRRQMGKRARQTALDCTWDHTADRYEALYSALAGRTA